MKNKSKTLSFLIIFYISLCLMAGISQNNNLMNNNIDVIEDPLDNIENPEKVKASATDPIIHVDNNWSAAVGAGIASGSGNWSDPYVIQDKIIDGQQAPYGVYIQNSDNYYFRIQNCTVYNANIAGIVFSASNNGTIINCNVSFNADAETLDNEGIGIWISGSENATINNNILCNNSEYGLYISSSNGRYDGNWICNNTRDGIRLPGGGASNCNFTNNHIEDNTWFGWAAWGGTNNLLEGNEIIGNGDNGIHLYGPDGNTIIGNLIKDNGDTGINFANTAINNKVYKNAIINNVIQAASNADGNQFNTSSVGNYWDDYGGNDNDGDGIGDTAYDSITGTNDVDNFPIQDNPFHNGEKIWIDEEGINALNWSQTALIKNWISGSGAYSNPYVIQDLEINCGGSTNGIHIENSINGDYFVIQNCKITNSGPSSRNGGIYIYNSSRGIIIGNNCSYNNENGISLYEAFNHTISNNIATHNAEGGIAIEGEDIYKCENISISNNIVDYNRNGIRLERSINLTVFNNSAFTCSYDGIYCWWVDNSDFIENYANNCTNDGILMYICENNTLIGNIFNNNSRHGIYSYQNFGGHIIRNNTANNNTGYGIALDGSGSGTNDDNNVSENVICGNKGFAGLFINSADNNRVYNNLIKENTQRGIYVGGSSYDNIIYNNSFIGNGLHAYDLSSGMNYYNSSTTGNYWDNYTGVDSDGDGFGDDPYIIRVSPLRQDEMPIWSYSGNIYIDGLATGVGAHNWTWAASQSWCTGSGTSEDPYVISGVYLNVGGIGNCLEIQDSSVYFRVQDCIFKDAGTGSGIYLFDVNNGTFKNNLIINNKNGITVWSCENNSFIRNNITLSAQTGIDIDTSVNNGFTLNEISNNTNYGVRIGDISSVGNIFHKNAFLDNGIHALDDSNTNSNYWNNSVIGNYWDNHSTTDSPIDGIDDTQYDWIAGSAGAIDYLPIHGDPRYDGGLIAIDDGTTADSWIYYSTRFWVSGSGTWSDPYLIEGLTVNCGGGDTGIEVQNSYTKYFTIKDCYIKNTGSYGGIHLYETRNGTLLNNYIIDSSEPGINLEYSHNISIINNQIYKADYGMYLDSSDNNTITGNSVFNNTNDGIYQYYSNNCDFFDNTVMFNGDSGIMLLDCDYTDLSGNTLSFNNGSGLEMLDCLETDIINNGESFNNNSYYGIYLKNSNSSIISGNTANNNNIGIYLNFAHNNIITGNTFLGNNEWKYETANSTGNTYSDNDYGQSTNGKEEDDDDTAPPEGPMDFMMYIIIGVIIGAVAVVGGIIAKGKSSKEGKTIVRDKKKKKGKKEVSDKPKLKVKETALKSPITPKAPKSPKAPKMDKIEFEEEISSMTQEELKELQKTEAEVDVEKKEYICVVHKGPIEGDIYLCPKCHTLYCVKCAKTLKERGEKCWSCETEIKTTGVASEETSRATETISEVPKPSPPPESEEKGPAGFSIEKLEKIAKYEEAIEQINATIQKLDIKFSAGALSQEDYIAKKNYLAEKLGEATARMEQLKEE